MISFRLDNRFHGEYGLKSFRKSIDPLLIRLYRRKHMGRLIPPEQREPANVSIRLLKDYQAGDANALNQLLKRIGPRVLLSVRSRRDRKFRSKVDSLDILQEVMQDALPRLKNLEVWS